MIHPDIATLDEQIRAFDACLAGVRVDVRLVRVSGGEARAWLDDLVTAGIASLAGGGQTRSLLLTPTGRIRADFHVVADGAAFVLVQPRDQEHSVSELLERYVLSSDVRLDSANGTPVHVVRGEPDVLVVLGGRVDGEIAADAFEAWRIRRGIARFPVDIDHDSTPAEGHLDRLIDTTKGCFLGQEAVAKIRNLGHPARVTVARFVAGDARPGEEVTSAGRTVGTITSAAPSGAGSAVIARVAWKHRDGDLRCPTGRLART